MNDPRNHRLALYGEEPPTLSAETLDRGLYWAPWRDSGAPVLMSITSAGDQLQCVALEPDVDPDALIEVLRAYLDGADPLPERPRLAIVR